MTKSLRLVMCIILALFLAGASIVGGLVRGAVMPAPTGVVTSIHLVRTGASQASVLGTSLGAGEAIDVLVNSVVVKSGTTMYNGDYWFLGVPVSDGATIQTRIGTYSSSTATVPAFVPQPVGPPGFIYAQGSSIMRDGQVVQLFGVDEQTVFINGLIASGLWGTPDPSAWGKNQLFPSGPETKIPNVSDADGVFREYFRYFLHYNAVAGSGTNPRLNLLRVWVADDSWYPEGMYLAWKNNPTAFFQVFDRMVYWARQAGVYVVPVLGHFASNKDNRFFDTSDIRFSHQVDVVRGIMDRYNTEPQIAMWDLWNEPDVDNDVYWASVGGQVGFRAWATTYIAAVKPHSSNHLLTIGMGGWDLFPGVPSFGWQYEFFWNEIPGLQVGHHHTYGTSEDQYLIDWNTDWQRALGIPHYEGETGFNQYPGPSPLGYGYWPWFSQHTRSAGWASVSTMVFLDNGKGVYTDYPYLGPLPAYPNGSSSDLPPTASFVSAPGAPLPGDTVTFDASASTDDHGIASYGWQFGDGGTAQGTIVTHAYGTAGDFQAVVVVTDTGGNTATAAATIHVGAPTPNDTTAPANVVDLRVVSQGPTSVTLRWTAPGDDGTTGQATWYDVRYTTTGPITGSTYYAATHYDVAFPQPPGTTEQATVSGLTSGSSYWFALRTSDEVPNWSGVSNSPTAALLNSDLPPTASFVSLPGTPLVGDTVTFDASASTDDHGITSYAWQFGDGGTAQGTISTHAYGTAGDFQAVVVVTDTGGNTASATATIHVGTPPPNDTTAPANVVDLRVVSQGPTSVTLRWTAPGDDGTTGQATWYDFRYSKTGPITELTFYAATHYEVAFPQAPGSTEQATVSGLRSGSSYWFALRTSDEVPNWSGVSNSPAAALLDTIKPAPITDLRVAATGGTYVTLRWTASGDDGRSGQATWYDFRISTVGPITESNFYAARHRDIPFPKTPGSPEQLTVSGLNRATRYWFAIKTSDEVPNWSLVSNSPSAITRFCYLCGAGLPEDSFGIEGFTDTFVLALAIVGIAAAVAACRAIGAGGSGPRARGRDAR